MVVKSKLVFSLDWLTLNFEKMVNPFYEGDNVQGNELLIEETEKFTKYKIEKQEYGTSVFKNRYFVKNDNYKIMTILENPSSQAINMNLVQIQVSNSELYRYDFLELAIRIETITKSLGIQFKSISRIDLAIDFEAKSELNNLVGNLMTKKYLLAGKKKKFTPRFSTDDGVLSVETLEIGTRTNDRFARIYNKTLELEVHPKEYIKNKHAINGLNSSVWRYEYQIKSGFLTNLNIKNMQLKEILRDKTLIDLFRVAETNHFEIKYIDKKVELNKQPTIPFVDYNQLTTEEQTIYIIKNNFESSIVVEKRTLKALFREYYLSSQTNLTHIDNIKSIINRTELSDFFNKKIDYYIREFDDKLKRPFKFDYELFRTHYMYYYKNQNINEIIPF